MNRARLLCVCLVLGGPAACGRNGYEPHLPDAAFPDGAVDVDAGPEPEVGYRVRGSWLLRGVAPTAASCDADGISLVRLQVLDEDARVLDELLGPCEHGSFEGSTTLAWGVRRYGEWVALGDGGEVRQRIPVSMPIVTNTPYTVLTVRAASFEVRPLGELDYAAGGRITLGAWDDTTVCETRGIAEVRLTLTDTTSSESVAGSAPCDGPSVFVRTPRMLEWEREYSIRWEALGPGGAVVVSAELAPVTASSPVQALFGLDAAM